MKVKLAAIVLIAMGIGAVALAIVGPSLAGTSSTKYLTSPATVAVVRAQSVANGTVGASTVYGLKFGSQPDIVSSVSTSSSSAASSANSAASNNSNGNSSSGVTWPVVTVSTKVGQTVKKGDVLATADTASAKLQLASAQSTLASAKARLATDKGGPDATTLASAKDQVNQAQNQLNQAIANQKSTQAQNALTLSQAKAAVTSAQDKLAADTAASAPQSVIDADNTAIANAKSQLASTELKVSQSNQQAAQQVTSAQLGLTSAKHQYDLKVAPAASTTVLADEAQVSSAQAAVDSAQAAVDAATLTAPADGLVIAVNILPGVNAPSGEAIEVQAGPMVATASFAEADVSSLKVGQAASVTVSAAKVAVDGTVSQIAPVAASSSGSSSVVTYTVTVTLTSPPATVLAGMSATVAVTTAEAPSSVTVPAAALQGSAAAGYSVQVMAADGSLKTVSVQVGLVTSSAAQITSGINAGEAVVIGTTTPRTGTTTAGGGGLNLGGLGGGGGNFRNPGAGR